MTDQTPSTEEGRALAEWLRWAMSRLAGVPDPSAILVIEAKARATSVDADDDAPKVTPYWTYYPEPDDDLFVILDGPPGPESGRFVELETRSGRSVGERQTGAKWSQSGDLWQLGPFRAVTATATDRQRVAALEDALLDVRRWYSPEPDDHPRPIAPIRELWERVERVLAPAAPEPRPAPPTIDVDALTEAVRSALADWQNVYVNSLHERTVAEDILAALSATGETGE